MKNLKIQILGTVASGKFTIGQIIFASLKTLGFDVEFIDDSENSTNFIEEKIESLKEKTKISIVTKQINS